MKRINILFLALLICSSVAGQDYKDVAPIFFSRCTSCHHEGGAGPFPFMQYSETAVHAPEIYTALVDGFMPPWSPDTTYTRFLHERIITDSEKNTILNWIINNTPAGDTTLAPTPPTYSAYQLYGTPSLELQIPTFTSNATTTDSYICFSLPTNLPQERVLRAFEIVPGNPEIVHHVLVNADTLGTTVDDLSGTCYTIPGDFGIGGYAPGAPPTVFPGQAPLKLGIPLKAGSKLVLQIHYPAGSAGMIDSTKIRLYFYPLNEPGIRPVGVATFLQNWSLFLPPNIISTYTAQFPALPLDISMLAAFPHSHLLCTNLVNYAATASDTIPLIRINEWDFEWQGYYSYRFPVRIPSGHTLNALHTYDNTVNNPNNPNNPPITVIAGLSTSDEMLFDSYQFTYYLPGDELIDIGLLLDGDSLLSGSPQGPVKNNFQCSAFPVPFGDKTTIRVSATSARSLTVGIYDIFGKLVAMPDEIFNDGENFLFEWHARDESGDKVTPGIYFYRVRTGSGELGGKLVFTGSD